MPDEVTQTQDEVIGFLKSGRAFSSPEAVTHIQTHCAHVFLAGEVALKLKRAVCYDYLDQSTPGKRQALLRHELRLNTPIAPMIYRDVVPITRTEAGGLELDGPGPPVDWVLRMHRFSADCEMTAVAASGRLTDAVAEALGRAVHAFHQTCPPRPEAGDALIRDILDELARVILPMRHLVPDGLAADVLDRARRHLALLAGQLRDRTAHGQVRRAHGDLHLRNVLLIDAKPVLFDALEFDERLATCDVLYDLGFLLMDLCHRGLVRQSNAAMNAYLVAAAGAEDAGLSALPLFMAVRAAIRAMVLLQTDQATGQAGASRDEAEQYLRLALALLRPEPPVLIAIGGQSGTGKTVLARALAAGVGSCPGAVHLRTDTERKARGAPVDYAPAARGAVYRQMLDRAGQVLAAGRSVVLDATFLDPALRKAAEDLAVRSACRFRGLLLSAPLPVLIDRISRRQEDPSDADARVARAQDPAARSAVPGTGGWISLDASGTPDRTRAAACAALAGALGIRVGDTRGD